VVLDEIMYGATMIRWCACRGAKMRWRANSGRRRAIAETEEKGEEEEEEDGERERKKSINEVHPRNRESDK